MIIFRYLAKEVHLALSLIIGILLLIFISNQLVRYLAKAAAGKLSGAVVMKVIALQVPYLLGLLLPLGLYLAILVAYGRLYAESEMTVMTACGLSRGQLIRISMLFSSFVLLLVIVLNFYVSPHLLAYQNELKANVGTEALVSTIIPGRFQVSPNGREVYYIESMSRDRENVNNIFIAVRDKDKKKSAAKTKPEHERWSVVSATSAHQEDDPKTGNSFIVAEDGYRYQGSAGEKAFRIAQFGKYGMRLGTQPGKAKQEHHAMSTSTLWKLRDTDSHAMAELQWRLGLPISVPILVLLAVILSKVRPRQGRYAQLLPAILIYTVYANMMFVARNWVEDKVVPAYIGLWWLHLCLLAVALLLLIDRERLWWRIKTLLPMKRAAS